MIGTYLIKNCEAYTTYDRSRGKNQGSYTSYFGVTDKRNKMHGCEKNNSNSEERGRKDLFDLVEDFLEIDKILRKWRRD